VLAPIAVGGAEAKDFAMSRLRIGAWVVAFANTLFLGIWILQVASGQEDWPVWIVPGLVAALLAPSIVGLLIANRQPRNVIAWILLLGPLPLTVQAPVSLFVSEGWVLQLDRATWPLLYAWPLALAFVFPNGRLLSPRWRWIAGAAAVSFLGFVVVELFNPGEFYGEDESVPNPVAGNAVGEWLEATYVVVLFLFGSLAGLIAGVVAMVVRKRRAEGIERLQMLWLTWSTGLIALVLAVCIATSFALGDSVVDWFLLPLLLLVLVAIAVSVGIAVLRYRLYDIELIVNRTLVYATLTLLLLAAYTAITVGLGVFVGGDTPWVIALATLAVALAFRPLRARIQELVDRRYRRARYEGVRLIGAFEDEVRNGRRAPEEIGVVLVEALGDPLAELYFWIPDHVGYADVAGERRDALPSDERARREIERGHARTAVLLHDPSLLERPDFLNGVVAAAALSIEMARLTIEVRLQLAEVEASRRRIVEAGYEERRRLERDLHDGAQQRLVSLGVQLRRMQLALPAEAKILSPALDQIVGEVGAAIADMRQIAAGVRPARLDDGLAAALRDLARTAPIPVAVDASRERVAASVEAAAYFVACEAITNAVKHGSASKVDVRTVRENASLHVSVADDGVGGAVIRRGSGLAGLRDRVAAHGGTFELVSPRGRGTRIEVAIPCES
jgi:signal transduction histidine kinase